MALKDGLSDSREKLSLTEERNIDLIRQAIEHRNERQELTGSLYEDLSSMRRRLSFSWRASPSSRNVSAPRAGAPGNGVPLTKAIPLRRMSPGKRLPRTGTLLKGRVRTAPVPETVRVDQVTRLRTSLGPPIRRRFQPIPIRLRPLLRQAPDRS